MIEPEGAPSHRWGWLLLAFGLSGFAGLVYQTAWTREFAFVFGTSELAVAAVLAGYFGGLACGAAVAARVVDRVRRPLLLYGVLEVLIGAAALAVPWGLAAAMKLHLGLFAHAGSSLEEAGGASLAFYLAASFAVLILPTGAMGATLPLLARHAVRREGQLGRRIGLLYALNTAGAVLGVLLAGFWLLPAFGLGRTVAVAALGNGLVFALAFVLARGEPPLEPSVPPGHEAHVQPGARWILPAVALSGAASFLYEVLWTRLLVHLVGSSLYAFATMLASFLVGIALGAAIAAPVARSSRAGARGFGVAQVAIAGLSGATYLLLDRAPAWAAHLAELGLGGPASDAVLCAALLLPGATAIGATFPLAVCVLARGAGEAGRASGRIYAWNTVGAIVGALGAGFFWIPRMGFHGAAMLAIATNLALAAWSALRFAGRSPALGVVALAGLALLAALPLRPPENLLRTSPLARRPASGAIVYQRVGRNADVLVLETEGEYVLRMNGLPESAIQPPGGRAARYSVARWLGALPSLMRPETESVLVVGLGGAIALESVPPSVRSIEVIEIEREALRANQALSERRGVDPLADPRVRVHVNDARNGLLLARRRFDAIVSQPSHPWTSGASHLYTREFFELVRSRLEPGGVFVQWIGLRFVDEPLLRTLVATLDEVFPYVRAYRPARRPALLFAASTEPLAGRRAVAEELARAPALYRRLGLVDGLDLEAAWTLDAEGARAFGAGAPSNRDRHNLLEARSPGVARSGRRPPLGGALPRFDPLAGRVATNPLPALVRRLVQRAERGRALRIVAAAPEGPDRLAARGLLAASAGRVPQAERMLALALQADPRHPEARATLLRLHARRAGTEPAPLPTPLTALEEACWKGWTARREADSADVRALEPALARALESEPLFEDALRLRAWWRVASGNTAHAREALGLLDPLLARVESPQALVLRSRAALLAGAPRGAVATLAELATSHPAALRLRPIRLQARSILEALPEEPPFRGWRRDLERRLGLGTRLPAGAAAP